MGTSVFKTHTCHCGERVSLSPDNIIEVSALPSECSPAYKEEEKNELAKTERCSAVARMKY